MVFSSWLYGSGIAIAASLVLGTAAQAQSALTGLGAPGSGGSGSSPDGLVDAVQIPMAEPSYEVPVMAVPIPWSEPDRSQRRVKSVPEASPLLGLLGVAMLLVQRRRMAGPQPEALPES